MNWQDNHTIYETIVVPLLGIFPEIRWFADSRAAVTPEASGGSVTGWTHKLAEAKKIKLPANGKKYIELERMLSSVIMFMQFFDGSDAAYKKFISVQSESVKLTRESFGIIHKITKDLCIDAQSFNQLVAMLVYSDAGKTSEALRRAEKFRITAHDHDDWADKVLELESQKMTAIFPGLIQLIRRDPNFIKQLKHTHAGMKIHLGHLLHLEGGQKIFSKLLVSIKNRNVTQNTLDIIFIINLADVAAARAHVNPNGSLALTETTFMGYQYTKAALKVLEQTRTAKEALAAYTTKRAEKLGFSKDEFLLIRFAAQIRHYSEEDGKAIKIAAEKMLTGKDYEVLQRIFGEEEGINIWMRNPTYIPAVLINLFEKGGVKAALEGFVCVAQLLKNLSQQNPSIITSDEPLCFNSIAKLAKEKSELFDKEKFEPRNFALNEKQEIIHRPAVWAVYADQMFFRKLHRDNSAEPSSILQATSRRFQRQ